MLESAMQRIVAELPDDAVVVDVGGGANPFPRADWVVDLQHYDNRGAYAYDKRKRAAERFGPETWVSFDICARETWPFTDDQFDFAVCAHTLEDVRDPIRVCEELTRVASAGYIEVPAPVEELTWGVHGPWVGWSHHRWICELEDARIVFTHKPHLLCDEGRHLPKGTCDGLAPEQRVLQLWWKDRFDFDERMFFGPEDFDPWLARLLGSNRRERKRLFRRA